MFDLEKYEDYDELHIKNDVDIKEVCLDNYEVNVTTGGFCIEQTDLILEDVAGEFRISRKYDSLVEIYGWIAGCRWMFNIESILIVLNNQILIILPDSHVEKFDIAMTGYFNVDPGSGFLLMGRDDGGYVLFERDAVKQYDYNNMGKIETITDKNGNKTEFIYTDNILTRVNLASGQAVSMTYDEGHLLSITDTLGRSVVYQYENDYLSRVLYPDNTGIIYKYYQFGAIQSVINKNGISFVENEYDDRGRVIVQAFANGAYYKYAYDDFNMVNSKYDTTYDTWTSYWYNENSDIIRKEYYDQTFEVTEYDYLGKVITKIDRKGNMTTYTNDTSGNCTQICYPNGLTINKEYNDTGMLSRITDNAGREECFEYDERGNVVLNKKKINDELWYKREYIYDDRGRILSEKDGLGHEKLYEYTTLFSRPSAIRNKSGQTIMFEYDMAGRIIRKYTDSSDIRFEYDVFNRIIKVIDGDGNTTRMCYNKDGKMTRKILPNQYNPQTDNGQGIVYEYDKAGKLVKMIMPSGAVKLTKRNTDGKVIKEILPNSFNPSKDDGEGSVYEYDRDGRCTRIKRSDNSVERFFYDSCGNIVKKVLPTCYKPKNDDGEGYAYKYDCMNNITLITGPDGKVEQENVYDIAGNIVRKTGKKGYSLSKNEKARKGTIIRYDLWGNVVEKREYVKEESPGYRVTKYEYDQECNLIKEIRYLEYQMETGAVGRTAVRNFEYDADGRKIKIIDGCGGTTQYEYDALDRKVLETIAINDNTNMWRKYEYNKSGRLSAVVMSSDARFTKKSSVSIIYRYDRNGNISEIVTPKENIIKRSYDLDNRLVDEEHIDATCDISNKISYAYDYSGNISMEIDVFGATQSFFYDSMNRVIKKTNKYGGITRYFYDAEGKVIKEVKPNEYAKNAEKSKGWLFDYDSTGHLLKKTSPEGVVILENKYNEFGELIESIDAVGSKDEYKYDFAGRKTTIKKKCGEVRYKAYDPFDRVVAVHDGKYRMTGYELDEEGRTKAVLHPDGNVEKITFDYAGNVVEHSDIQGNVTKYLYNEINKLLSKTYPDGQDEKFAYDEDGNIAIIADRNKNGVENTYNIYGDLVYKKDMRTGMCIRNSYFVDGKLKNTLSEGVRFGFEYDKAGNICRKKSNEKVVAAFSYDVQGNKQTISEVSDKLITYKYDICDNLSEISDGKKTIVEFEYYTDGLVKKKKMCEGKLVTEYKYDIHKNITEIITTMDTEKIADNKYSYDDNGKCTKKKSIFGEYLYEYDYNMNPLKAQYSSHNEKICYDNTGLRTRKNVIKKNDSYAEFYTYVNGRMAERIVTDPYGNMIGKINYQYDKSGNIVNDGNTTFKYDCFGRMIKSENTEGNIQRYRYDGIMNRYEVEEGNETVQFIFDENKLIKECRTKGTMQYIWANNEPVACYIEKDNRYLYFILDNNGSVTHLVDGKFVVNTYDYDVFGTVIGWSENIPNRLMFQGKQYDAKTGLYYSDGVYYNPIINVYLSEHEGK